MPFLFRLLHTFCAMGGFPEVCEAQTMQDVSQNLMFPVLGHHAAFRWGALGLLGATYRSCYNVASAEVNIDDGREPWHDRHKKKLFCSFLGQMITSTFSFVSQRSNSFSNSYWGRKGPLHPLSKSREA